MPLVLTGCTVPQTDSMGELFSNSNPQNPEPVSVDLYSVKAIIRISPDNASAAAWFTVPFEQWRDTSTFTFGAILDYDYDLLMPFELNGVPPGAMAAVALFRIRAGETELVDGFVLSPEELASGAQEFFVPATTRQDTEPPLMLAFGTNQPTSNLTLSFWLRQGASVAVGGVSEGSHERGGEPWQIPSVAEGNTAHAAYYLDSSKAYQMEIDDDRLVVPGVERPLGEPLYGPGALELISRDAFSTPSIGFATVRGNYSLLSSSSWSAVPHFGTVARIVDWRLQIEGGNHRASAAALAWGSMNSPCAGDASAWAVSPSGIGMSWSGDHVLDSNGHLDVRFASMPLNWTRLGLNARVHALALPTSGTGEDEAICFQGP